MIGIFITRDGLVATEKGDWRRRYRVHRATRPEIKYWIADPLPEAIHFEQRTYEAVYASAKYVIYEER